MESLGGVLHLIQFDIAISDLDNQARYIGLPCHAKAKGLDVKLYAYRYRLA
jgi:hypothetical protein